MNYIERGPTDCWEWVGDSGEAPNKDCRMACLNPLCCNPRHVVARIKVQLQDRPSIDDYRKVLQQAGVKVDKRWGLSRLRAEVDKLENGDGDSE